IVKENEHGVVTTAECVVEVTTDATGGVVTKTSTIGSKPTECDVCSVYTTAVVETKDNGAVVTAEHVVEVTTDSTGGVITSTVAPHYTTLITTNENGEVLTYTTLESEAKTTDTGSGNNVDSGSGEGSPNVPAGEGQANTLAGSNVVPSGSTVLTLPGAQSTAGSTPGGSEPSVIAEGSASTKLISRSLAAMLLLFVL
ncbi:hypothetical protein DIURU_000523, partial [Diutina rugosa]